MFDSSLVVPGMGLWTLVGDEKVSTLLNESEELQNTPAALKKGRSLSVSTELELLKDRCAPLDSTSSILPTIFAATRSSGCAEDFGRRPRMLSAAVAVIESSWYKLGHTSLMIFGCITRRMSNLLRRMSRNSVSRDQKPRTEVDIIPVISSTLGPIVVPPRDHRKVLWGSQSGDRLGKLNGSPTSNGAGQEEFRVLFG
jgi:hypothetical protein